MRSVMQQHKAWKSAVKGRYSSVELDDLMRVGLRHGAGNMNRLETMKRLNESIRKQNGIPFSVLFNGGVDLRRRVEFLRRLCALVRQGQENIGLIVKEGDQDGKGDTWSLLVGFEYRVWEGGKVLEVPWDFDGEELVEK
ncbi:hypothetical protein HDU76_004837, partial [Blyttiomyces sp. JEL0837]